MTLALLDEVEGRPSRGSASTPRFALKPWHDIKFEADEEWLIKRVLPRRGLATIYGKPGSFKSFIAFDLSASTALGRSWAGRRVVQGPVVYVAAEGAAGIHKRKAAYEREMVDLPETVPFALISAAPNLGAAPGDLPALITAIEAAGIRPVMIVIDTLAKAIGAADENGAGMGALVINAGELAARFDCLVLAVHHVGLSDGAQQRLRGHSSLHGALDAQILCERLEGQMSAVMTLQKLKDDASDVKFTASLSRVVLAHDADGDEISTLIVSSICESVGVALAQKARPVAPSHRLLMEVVAQAIGEIGEELRPFGDGPIVRGVPDEIIRAQYYARVAEQADPEEDPTKVDERRRRSFNRALKALIDAKRITAAERNGGRYVWLPRI